MSGAMLEALPCPVCNGQKGRPMVAELTEDAGGGWTVACYGCNFKIFDGWPTREKAIAVWNTRPAAEAPPERADGSIPPQDPTKSKSEQGLFSKFCVRRTDGSDAPGGKHDGCEYFILDVTHDKYAKAALWTYAYACWGEFPYLSNDMIRRWDLNPPAGSKP